MTQPSQPCRLLVVDDHQDTQRLMARAFSGAGYAVSTAGNFDAAMGLARAQRFDLVITDVWLPDRDGCDLLAEVGTLYPVRAIVLSGADPGRLRPRCAELGARFIQKPVDVVGLLRAAAAELVQPRRPRD